VIEAFPSGPAARAFTRLSRVVQTWPTASGPRGNLEFFVERLVAPAAMALEAVR
jgi:flagellar biosynthesis protein FlhG